MFLLFNCLALSCSSLSSLSLSPEVYLFHTLTLSMFFLFYFLSTYYSSTTPSLAAIKPRQMTPMRLVPKVNYKKLLIERIIDY